MRPVGRVGDGDNNIVWAVSQKPNCRKLILGRENGWECSCASSWCDLDLTINLAVVTLRLDILSRVCHGNRKVRKVDTLLGY